METNLLSADTQNVLTKVEKQVRLWSFDLLSLSKYQDFQILLF